jgi:nucleoside-diphosphate-sugar epimerase
MAEERPALVTGGCGFVGRHLLKALHRRGYAEVWVVDDLSTGKDPKTWLGASIGTDPRGIEWFQWDQLKVAFLNKDLASLLISEMESSNPILPHFGDVFHLASIVGGRLLIDGDPLLVARDLAIDALLFQWLTRHPDRAQRVLYASSSAAYPVQLQQESGHVALVEGSISFNGGNLGQPDMTYGWSKLTGEYLATLAAKHYSLHVACVRPFSGYGEDQDPSNRKNRFNCRGNIIGYHRKFNTPDNTTPLAGISPDT